MAARFWVGGSGVWDGTSTANWAATSGGAAGASAPADVDTATFDANSGTAAVVSVAATAVSLSTTVNKADITLTLTGSPTLCTSAGLFTLTTGTLTLGSNILTVGRFNSANSNIRTINFDSGKIIVTGNSATIWTTSTSTNGVITGAAQVEFNYSGSTGTRSFVNSSGFPFISFSVTAGSDIVTSTGTTAVNNFNFMGFTGTLGNAARNIRGNLTISSGMTLTAGTLAQNFTSTSGTQLITTAGKTFDFPLTFNGIGGTMAFQDALTQGSTRAFTITNGTVQLKNGVTSTVGAFATLGTNQKFIASTTEGAQATISQASGTISATNLTIKDINATGGAAWNALWSNNNVDAGNNSGWIFGDPPITLATEYTYSIRSFTQPRRF